MSGLSDQFGDALSRAWAEEARRRLAKLAGNTKPHHPVEDDMSETSVVVLQLNLSVPEAIALAEELDGGPFDQIAVGLRRAVVSEEEVEITRFTPPNLEGDQSP